MRSPTSAKGLLPVSLQTGSDPIISELTVIQEPLNPSPKPISQYGSRDMLRPQSSEGLYLSPYLELAIRVFALSLLSAPRLTYLLRTGTSVL
jgi:hypothetical protein